MLRLPSFLVLALVACGAQPPPAATPTPAPAPPAPAPPAPAPPAPVQPAPTAPVQPAPVPPAPPVVEPTDDLGVPIELSERGSQAMKLWSTLRIDRSINPFYLRADFDGDGQPDYLFSADTPGIADDLAEPGLIVLFARPGAIAHLVDDEQLSLPARDGWYVHDRSTRVPPSFDGKPPPKLLGDAFVMMKAESSSALIYWDGKRFRSHWLSD